MLKYLSKRIGRSILTLFVIVTLVFCLLRLMPVEGYFANYEKMTEAQIQAACWTRCRCRSAASGGMPSTATWA
mgnify:CR=1 FL=1